MSNQEKYKVIAVLPATGWRCFIIVVDEDEDEQVHVYECPVLAWEALDLGYCTDGDPITSYRPIIWNPWEQSSEEANRHSRSVNSREVVLPAGQELTSEQVQEVKNDILASPDWAKNKKPAKVTA